MDELLIAFVKSAVLVLALLTGFAYMTLLERRLLGRIQLRYGPNRVGPFGLLQPLADGIKLVFKEEIVPRGADRAAYFLAPALSVVAALLAFAVIPIGGSIHVFGRDISLSLADLNIGVLFLLAVNSMGVYGIVLGGWSSNNKSSLLGGVRSSAQLISYELALGLAVVGVVLMAGSLRLRDIVASQDIAYAFLMPLGFLLYFVAGIAETNRAFEAAFRRGDHAGAAREVYTRDARVMPPGAPTVIGVDAAAEFWPAAARQLGIVEVALATDDLQPMGDGAYEVGHATLTLAGGQQVVAKYVVIWRQEDGRWRWHVDIWNLDG